MPTTLPALDFARFDYPTETLLDLYTSLLRPRLIEEKMLKQLRQGVISKWFSGIGQEAISVACARALVPGEWMFTMHRNLGVFTARGVPLARLFAQWQGKPGGYTKGRDRSFHFGAPEHHIVGMISHLGPQLALAAGVALRHKLLGERKVSLAFTGDGGTSEGDFHEALNIAAVWQLPVIFVVENNGYGLSTPVSEQYACARLSDRGAGYGMRAVTIDGNNILEVHDTISRLAAELREHPEPVLVECETFRVRGHEEASGVKYVPAEEIEAWQQRDPVDRFGDYLRTRGLLTEADDKQLRKSIKAEIADGLRAADELPEATGDVARELADLYAPYDTPEPNKLSEEAPTLRFIDAVSDALRQSMRRHDELVLMGQDIAGYGGVFKITEGFVEAFGKDRVRNTPLCESGVVGVGLGLSIAGGQSDGGDAVRGFRDLWLQPDRQQPGQTALSVGRAGGRRDPAANWWWRGCRAVPQPDDGSLVHRRPRSEDRLPQHPGRREGLADERAGRPQPRPLLRAQSPVPLPLRPGAGG